jgi:hypothetical protein
MLLYFGMLAYRTYNVVVGRFLPAESWVETVAMDVWEDMPVVKVDIYRSPFVLQHGRFYWIMLYILRWFDYFLLSQNKNISFFQWIRKFYFLDKM